MPIFARSAGDNPLPSRSYELISLAFASESAFATSDFVMLAPGRVSRWSTYRKNVSTSARSVPVSSLSFFETSARLARPSAPPAVRIVLAA